MAVKAGRLPLLADRNTSFYLRLKLRNADLTGAELRAQVRSYTNAPGNPLIDLLQITELTETGIRFVERTYDSAGVPTSVVELFIVEADLQATPLPAQGAGDSQFQWDMLVTPLGGLKQRWFYGPFTVVGGVTRYE